MQADVGLDIIPCNDFAFYDQMLEMMRLVGAVGPRFGDGSEGEIPLDVYFAMARGKQGPAGDAAPLEMTKWFDTNYHYLVPEFHPDMKFRLASEHPSQAVQEARAAGVVNPRPVLIGPATFLLLGKIVENGFHRLDRLDELTEVYADVLRRFACMEVPWVQMDEPILATDLTAEGMEIFRRAYRRLTASPDRPRILLATYFGDLEDNTSAAWASGVEGLHLDLVSAPSQLDSIPENCPTDFHLSLGVVDGRNVWRTDLDGALQLLKRAAERLDPSRIEIAPSCSLLHSPMDVTLETELDPEIKEWLAFGVQKLEEVVLLTRAVNEGEAAVSEALEISREIQRKRRTSPRVVLPEVRRAQAAVTDQMTRRKSPYPTRSRLQRDRFRLPLLPITTIGSFPQTDEIRRLRADHRKGKISADQLQQELQAQTAKAIQFQEAADLDVLVHGEFERTDMVEYFAEQMDGFAFTSHGWVQSYGTRAVKPPILYGDVRRRGPMTVACTTFAQARTSRPVKGMLTGPVTLLKWSFVRDDQPRSDTCEQLALAVREEVADLERAGIGIIQIDEPALREGLPLHRRDWGEYLNWAVRCFRLASGGVRDDTQIHTHMCYAEFHEIMDSIADLDADVLSIEASRSRMDLLRSFEQYEYPNEIGPGVWDIHSPRIPSREEIIELLEKALLCIPPDQLWVNPDCGLKTRKWSEIIPALENMIAAAKTIRAKNLKASRVAKGTRMNEVKKSEAETPRFLKRLQQQGALLGDGAMGTQLYERGVYINRNFDQLNLTDPHLVKAVHRDYIEAGAEVLETNTFGANAVKLQKYGLAEEAFAINRAGAELARRCADEAASVLVAGSIGPLGKPIAPVGKIPRKEALQAFSVQADGLLTGGVDLFILETFIDLDEIVLAVQAIRERSDLPIVAMMTLDPTGLTAYGRSPEIIAETLSAQPVDVIGLNCSIGPHKLLEGIRRMRTSADKPLAAFPNAGEPETVEDRILYLATPEYFAEYTKRMLQSGVSFVGGCCGTTPRHIQAMSAAIRALYPASVRRKVAVSRVRSSSDGQAETDTALPPRAQRSPLGKLLDNRIFPISCEINPPRSADVTQVLEQVKRLQEAGFNVINIPDGPRASARIQPIVLAHIIQRETGMDTILHYTCRDRNILGMQSDLLGAAALGLHNLLAVTGDPPKLGDYPMATAVFDVDAIGLLRIADHLNHSRDLAGNPISAPTAFFLGAGFNPGAMDLPREIDRLHQKIAAGAEYLMTQPVFDPEKLLNALRRAGRINIPVFVGILPLISFRNAEFFQNEVPGMEVPERTLERMRRASAQSKEHGRQEGIAIAREVLLAALPYVQGAYIMPPLGKVESAIETAAVLPDRRTQAA